MGALAPWGHTLIWEFCGHRALVLAGHDLDHPHHCPVCEPGRTTCVEYLDMH